MEQLPHPRGFARKRVLKQGKVIVRPPSGTIDVIIRDIGPHGAKFEIATTAELPDKFAMIIVPDGTITPTEVMWRRGHFVGVHFCGETKKLDLRKF